MVDSLDIAIDELKERYAEQFQVNKHSITFVLRGRPLTHEHQTLEECGIQNRSKVMVMARAKVPDEVKQPEPEPEQPEAAPGRPAFDKNRFDE